ncbi:MAG: GerMN domain-containing protein [Vampirovibrionales bacterium]
MAQPAHKPPKKPLPANQTRAIQRVFVLIMLTLLAAVLVYGVLTMVTQNPPQPSASQATPSTPLPKMPQADTPSDIAITLYFSQLSGDEVVTIPTQRWMPHDYQPITLEWALEALLAGPTPAETKAGLYSEIPKGTRLLGVNASVSPMVINLSQAFALGGGSNSQQQRWNEVAQTLQHLKLKKPWILQVEGKPLEALNGEGLETAPSH